MQRYHSNNFEKRYLMNRRNALMNAALLTLATPLLIRKTFAGSKSSFSYNRNSFHKFSLGNLELTIISDGHILFPKIQPSFAPKIAPEQIVKALEDNFLSTTEVDLAINILVVKNKDRIILIDTGCGFRFGDSSGWLVENLKIAGINPKEVTDIVLTHAHPDHLGGLVDKDDNLIFPNADIYISRIEREFWMSNNPDFSKTKAAPQLVEMVSKIARNTLTLTKQKLHFFENNDVLFDCIRLKLAPGHTPGHTIVHIFSKENELFHLADLIHSAPLVVAHPDWGFEGDTDFDLAIQTRKKVLDELAVNRKMIFSYHLPWPGLGHVRKNKDSFDWVQTTFSIPD